MLTQFALLVISAPILIETQHSVPERKYTGGVAHSASALKLRDRVKIH
jgi:hypothetical protein